MDEVALLAPVLAAFAGGLATIIAAYRIRRKAMAHVEEAPEVIKPQSPESPPLPRARFHGVASRTIIVNMQSGRLN